ncbi:esterase-like activity of phytase family protein [Chelativorans sp. Marseille-P2723]|uniref:esterase-like activity of phytase family protein n=1 Tax=Chelativorans sp. Marseille-P2723 TaxID=2709133 RepID=UPI001FEDDB07|nr:esterase-like activity of phytase family protein [Chelativorans sp. Marseille-P2723]
MAARTLAISTRPIASFRIGSSETRFGALEFVGGLEMRSRDRDFGAISAFRFLDARKRFIGVTDTGFWFFGRLSHDSEGRPAGIDDFLMTPMMVTEGRLSTEKWETDAESLAVRGRTAVVGFERRHRLAEYRLDPPNMGAPLADLDFLIPSYELRANRGFETLAFAPEEGPLAGALIAITERSINKQGNIFAAILDGPMKGIFTVARSDGFDVTDGAFLPDGDLILLERRFTLASGVAMRLRRIPAAEIRPNGVADGPVLLEADMGYQIDNMEALDIWQRADGAIMLSLMSDDNHSILQRNLYLEFRLRDEAE